MGDLWGAMELAGSAERHLAAIAGARSKACRGVATGQHSTRGWDIHVEACCAMPDACLLVTGDSTSALPVCMVRLCLLLPRCLRACCLQTSCCSRCCRTCSTAQRCCTASCRVRARRASSGMQRSPSLTAPSPRSMWSRPACSCWRCWRRRCSGSGPLRCASLAAASGAALWVSTRPPSCSRSRAAAWRCCRRGRRRRARWSSRRWRWGWRSQVSARQQQHG